MRELEKCCIEIDVPGGNQLHYARAKYIDQFGDRYYRLGIIRPNEIITFQKSISKPELLTLLDAINELFELEEKNEMEVN